MRMIVLHTLAYNIQLHSICDLTLLFLTVRRVLLSFVSIDFDTHTHAHTYIHKHECIQYGGPIFIHTHSKCNYTTIYPTLTESMWQTIHSECTSKHKWKEEEKDKGKNDAERKKDKQKDQDDLIWYTDLEGMSFI